MISAWRLVHRKFIDSAFSGIGAKEEGGRFNSIGTKVIYTSSSISLACLEIIVHLEDYDTLSEFQVIDCRFDEALVAHAHIKDFPESWRNFPVPQAVQKIGDAWVTKGASAILRVPSVIVPSEFNFLINPDHSDFSKIRIGKPEPFMLDPRFLKT